MFLNCSNAHFAFSAATRAFASIPPFLPFYPPTLLTLTNIIKRFGSLTAVDDLSLSVHKGEVFGLLGPNGAGKSTTISMAVGLLTPDSGTVTIEGFGNPAHASARSALGVAPQSLAIYDDLTAEENLRFFAKLFALPAQLGRDGLNKRIDQTLDRVGLLPRKSDRVKTYSGGMKRRLNVAAALIHQPPVILLDEPTAGVDPQSRSSILDLVRELAAEGRAVVYTTHYMEEASKICDRIGIIDSGKLLALGTVDQLIASHGDQSVVTATINGETRTISTAEPVRALEKILAESKNVDSVRIDRPDLEAVFLKLTGKKLRD